MASYKRRQSSDYNQSVPETEFVPENHAYQEKHFQPTLNQPVSEAHTETEYGSTVTPDMIESRADKTSRSTVIDSSDQPGEEDIAKMQYRQNLQNNSDPGTQYSTPDVSSGVSSDPGGFSGFETTGTVAAAGTSTAAATTVVASSTAATLTSVAVATAGAVVIAATLILPLVVGVPSAIIFDEIIVTDTTVYYSIYFEDYEEDMELTVSLHNNFTDRSHTVESENISVTEENLKPGMTYKLTVYGSMGAVLGEKTITMKKSSEPEPTLTVDKAEFSFSDAKIHLTASLDDPKGSCSDFSVVYYDVKGSVRTEVERMSVEDFSSEITMAVGLAKDTSVNGILAVECMDGGESRVLYESEMTAYGAPYFDFDGRPTITGETATVNLIIVDPAGDRTDYYWMFSTQEDTDTSMSFSDSGQLTGSSFTVTGVPTYDHQSFFIKVSWEESGRGDLRTLEYKTYESPVAVKTAGMWLEDMGNNSFVLEVPVTVNDPSGIWTDLELVLGDASYSSTTYGYSSVISFSSSDTLITIPVTEAGLYGKSVPLSVRNGPSVILDTFPAFVAGPNMTVGYATMNKVDVTIGGKTYETRFDVEISNLVDDLHYLTDSSGTWTLMPTLNATGVATQSGEMTALSVTPTGEGSYVASFYTDTWNEAMMYRVNDVFRAAGVSKSFSMIYVNEEVSETYTTRSSSGDIMAYVTVISSETVTAATAVSGSTEITGIVTPVYENYKIELNLTTADPYAEYTIYLYDGSTVLDSCVKITFPYPRLIEGSAVYNTSTGKATVQFEYDRSPIYMPDYFVSGNTEGGILTLTFDEEATSPVLTGDSYFRFQQSDKNPDYYWYTTFRIES